MSRDPRGSVTAVLVVFASVGFVMGQALARVPAVRDHLGADKAQLGLALMGMGLGSLLAMPFTGRLVDRFGSRGVVLVSVLLGCLGCLVQLPVLALLAAAAGVWGAARFVPESEEAVGVVGSAEAIGSADAPESAEAAEVPAAPGAVATAEGVGWVGDAEPPRAQRADARGLAG